jgi:hypothetical protein
VPSSATDMMQGTFEHGEVGRNTFSHVMTLKRGWLHWIQRRERPPAGGAISARCPRAVNGILSNLQLPSILSYLRLSKANPTSPTNLSAADSDDRVAGSAPSIGLRKAQDPLNPRHCERSAAPKQRKMMRPGPPRAHVAGHWRFTATALGASMWFFVRGVSLPRTRCFFASCC